VDYVILELDKEDLSNERLEQLLNILDLLYISERYTVKVPRRSAMYGVSEVMCNEAVQMEVL